MSARARRCLVWLAVARTVQDGVSACSVPVRDRACSVTVAVQLRLLRLRLRVRLVTRDVRRLHTLARRCALDDRRGRGCGVVPATAGGSFFSCPGEVAELPGAASLAPVVVLPVPLPLPLPLPFPLPAYAGTANAKTPRTSTNVPFSRMMIPPFPTFHVSEEVASVQRSRKAEGRPLGRPSIDERVYAARRSRVRCVGARCRGRRAQAQRRRRSTTGAL
jgi:hypothetical protein